MDPPCDSAALVISADAAVDQIVDQARAFCRAVLDGDAAVANELARAIAEAAAPVIDAAGDACERIRAGDPHTIRLAVRLLRLVLPASSDDENADDAAGGAR